MDADDEPRLRAQRFDAAEAGPMARMSLRSYRARSVHAAGAGRGNGTRAVAVRDARAAMALLLKALGTGNTKDLEAAVRRVWARYGGKGSKAYKLLFAQQLLRRLPHDAVWKITRALDVHGTSLKQKSDELAAWAKLFGRATRARGGIGSDLRNVLLTRRGGRFVFADEVATLCAIDPRLVSGPWRGAAAAMILGQRGGMGLGSNESIAVSLIMHDSSAQRWFWRWGEHFKTLTARNVHYSYLLRVIAAQLVRHKRDLFKALVGRSPEKAADGRRYSDLIAEIVARGGPGRKALIALGAKKLGGLDAPVRRAPDGALELRQAGRLWGAIIEGYKRAHAGADLTRSVIATLGGELLDRAPLPVSTVGRLVLGQALDGVFGKSDHTSKRVKEVLSVAYSEILAGVLRSDDGRVFRRQHPTLFRNGQVIDLAHVVRAMDEATAQGGGTDKILVLADAALESFRHAMGAG